MKDLLEYIVKNLVTNPDAVSISEQTNEGEVNFILDVDPLDMGIVIGKGGQTIKSIRRLLSVRAMAENVRVNLQLTETAERQTKEASEEETKNEEEPKVETSEDSETKEETEAKPEDVKSTDEN